MTHTQLWHYWRTMRAENARNAALEEAAKEVDKRGAVLTARWRAGQKADNHLEGQADASDDYSACIRALMTAPAVDEEKERMRKALKPFADEYELWSPDENDGHVFDDDTPLEGNATELTIGHLRAAAAALYPAATKG